MDYSSRQALSLYVVGIGSIAFLLGLAPIVNLVLTPLGGILGVGTIVGAIFFIFMRLRLRRGGTRAIVGLAIVGLVVFAFVYGATWYFISYMPAQGSPLFNFPLTAPTARP